MHNTLTQLYPGHVMSRDIQTKYDQRHNTMETNRNEGKEDDMIVLFSLTNTDPPLHGELEKHLSEVKEQVSRISSIKPVHKIHIPNGYVMTTRPELWDGYKLDAKSTVF